MQTLQGILTEHPFLIDLPAQCAETVTDCTSNVRFEAGKFIFQEGEEANRFYLIREGMVALQIYCEQRGPLTILTLSEGDVLGSSWVFPPYCWKFSAQAVRDTRTFAVDGNCLRQKAERDPVLGYELLKRFVGLVEQCLEATRLQLVNVYQDL